MSDPIMSDTITEDIRVKAVAQFVPEQSEPEEDEYYYTYRIIITNEGERRVKLLSRHWIIINSYGDQEEVRGEGVVGQTPTLDPGASFEYTSFCPLDTNFGTMEGSYQFADENGDRFDVAIGRFFLATTAPKMIFTES